MAVETYRGVVRGGAVVFLEGTATPADGTEVLVTPVAPEEGSPAALLAALASTPPVPAEWVDELERLIAEGERPPKMEGTAP